MPGNLRKRLGGKAGRSEKEYLRARKRVLQQNPICVFCRNAIDMTLPTICQYVNTDGFPVERAHEIPVDCDADCRGLKHARKANPWSKSADHKIPVAELPADSPLLTSVKNLQSCHLVCNQRKGAGKSGPVVVKTSRDWFA